MVTWVTRKVWKCSDGSEFPEENEAGAHRQDAIILARHAWVQIPFASSQEPLRAFLNHICNEERVPNAALEGLINAFQAELRARSVLRAKNKEDKGGR